MNSISFQVARLSDRHFVDTVFREASSEKVIKLRYSLFSSKDTTREADSPSLADPSSEIAQILNLDGSACRTIYLDFKGGGYVSLNRDGDTISITGFSDEIRANALQAKLLHALAGFRPGVPLAPILGDDLNRYYAAREATVSRLEESIALLLRKATEDLAKREEFFREKEKSIEEKLAQRIKDLDTERSAEKADLARKEADLAARIKDVDDRESKYARRAIEKALKESIKGRQAKFELTSGTKKLRWPVLIAVITLASGLGGGFLYYTAEIVKVMGSTPAPSTYVLGALLVRQVLLGLGFGGAIWYFIHWQNVWFQRHADEEFKIKRLELDFDRASWVIELAMEWAKENEGKDLPPDIMAQLTKNLFDEGDSSKRAIHRNDALTTLLGASASTELSLGNSKFTLNRKGAQNLKEKLTADE